MHENVQYFFIFSSLKPLGGNAGGSPMALPLYVDPIICRQSTETFEDPTFVNGDFNSFNHE